MVVVIGLASFCKAGLETNASWTAVGEAVTNYFGYSVASAGDVNGDGYSDVIVGAYRGGGNERGKAYVFLGSASGIQSATNWTAVGEDETNCFGLSVASAGDVNGDGYSDVIVGAYRGGGNERGKAYVFLGSASGIQSATNWTAVGEADTNYFGYSVASAGDVNGDGYGDVIVGAYRGGGNERGKAYVFLGSASGVQNTTNWSVAGEDGTNYFGLSVASAGDVNSDGYADVIIGAYCGGGSFRGKVYVFLGSASGVQNTTNWMAVGETSENYFGVSVASSGDVNGDGYGDVIVGAYHGGGSERGKAYVFLGSSSGVQSTTNWIAVGEAATNHFGYSVASAGDVNGDGYGDVIIGAYDFEDVYRKDTGKVYLFLGSASGVQNTTNWTVVGETDNNYLGISVASAGDVNGDGYGDVILGEYGYNNACGKTYCYHGSADRLSSTSTWDLVGEADENRFGRSVASAGDVNGDGYGDVIVGAYGFNYFRGKAYVFLGSVSGIQSTTNWTEVGEEATNNFGYSVASAGDVNGDGYDDVIVGAYRGGGNECGKVYVFLGSASGVQSTTNWMAAGEAGTNYFGYSVASAGDVNGDGYGDIIVGASGFDDLRGKAYVFLGSASGIQNTPNWTSVGETNVYNYFGYSVASAGDVNGDGYGDIIVGAYGYGVIESPYGPTSTWRGKAYVFLGSASGVQSTTNWMAVGETNENSFGNSVASAGDVNGDGFGDIIVGAYSYSSGGYAGRGKAYVFLGNASGVQNTTNWSTVGYPSTYTHFGYSVASAGDVNGDGYSDVIVGSDFNETGSGLAQVFLGSSSGVQNSTNWMAQGESYKDCFGSAVASAGDVNGDGYGDVIVGAYLHSVADFGKAYLYVGNAIGGRAVLARQIQPESLTPIAVEGKSTSGTSFAIIMNAAHPSGRRRVKLNVQAVPTGRAFGAAGTTTNTGAQWIDTGVSSSGIIITNTITGLQTNTAYRWRARVLSACMTVTNTAITNALVPVHSPWRTLRAGVRAYDVRTRTSLAPEMNLLGTNGAVIINNEPTSPVKGTDFGSVSWCSAQTNLFTMTNFGELALIVSAVSTNGINPSMFTVREMPATLAAGMAGTFNIVFSPTSGGSFAASVNISNCSTNTPFILNLYGTGQKHNQTITFPAISDQSITNTICLCAMALSGLPVSFAVGSGQAQIANETNLSFTGTGSVSIVASQAGNGNWNAAPSVTNSFMVTCVSTSSTAISSGVCADYDGDGLADPAVYDEMTGTWKVKLSSAGYYLIVTTLNGLGGPGYASVSADYDGDGKADPAVYHEATGIWLIMPSSANYAVVVVLGQTLGGVGYSGMPADYDGDQLADPGVYQREHGDWKVLLSSGGYSSIELLGFLGGTGYMAVAADYDGDRLADPAIYGESNGYWIFKLSSIGYLEIALTQTLGGTGYIPVPADYDGDGFTDPAVKSETSNEWIVMLSSAGYMPVHITLQFE